MMNRALLLVMSVVFLACSGGTECDPIENLAEFSKSALMKDVAKAQVTSGSDVKFVVVSNPFCFSEKDQMAIFMDGACVFSGAFSRDGVLSVPDEVFQKGQTHMRFFLVRGEKVYDYQNKSFTPLDREDKYLYVCFFVSDDYHRRVFWFSTRKSCIQV